MDVLQQIVEYKQSVEVPARRAMVPVDEMAARAAKATPARDMVAGLGGKAGVALIAEVKRASPSRGLLCPNFEPARLARQYVDNGAAAVSVLTDERFFQGSMEHLTAVREAVPQTPLLRKDFVVDAYQVYEARAAGADAVLLIARVLGDQNLAELLALARELGMTALIEVHDRLDLERVLPLGPRLVGINNRNLTDFSVRLDTCLALRSAIPASVRCVAESGIRDVHDVRRLAAAGIDAMLVGEHLVTAADVGAKVRELVDASQD